MSRTTDPEREKKLEESTKRREERERRLREMGFEELTDKQKAENLEINLILLEWDKL